MGVGRGALGLTTEPYSYERTLNWLHHQVAPSFKIAYILDRANDTSVMGDMITKARLDEKHEQLTPTVDNVV